MKLRVVAIDPPFDAGSHVLFGMQRGREVEEPVPATVTTVFDAEIEIVATSDATDFRGRYVHGRKGDRFLYLSWGLPDLTEPFTMFARAKIKLASIPAEVFGRARQPGHTLVCKLQATNSSGQPATGTIKAPGVSWHVIDEAE